MSTNGTTPTKLESPSSERLLTPTKISAWLECGHHMTLTSAVEAGTLRVTNGHLGAFARLLLEKGMDHERATLEKLRSDGLSVLSVPPRNPQTESFTEWCERVRPLLAEGHEIVYQFPMTHEGIRGIADFLVKVDTPSDLGPFSYEPADAKLARVEAKPAHVLQLCFYADGLAAIQGTRPTTAHLFLGSGEIEKIALAEVEAYWQRVRRNIFAQLTAETLPQTSPEPCQHCAFCEFADHCDAQWRVQDAIHFVSGITRRERDLCATAEVTSLHGLATNADQVIDIRPGRYDYLRTQAQLQAAATPGDIPPWQLRPIDEVHEDPSDDDNTGPHDYRLRLPAPDLGDVILDFEGHPFWTAESGLFFLFGWLTFDPQGNEWIYHGLWSHDRASEAANTAQLISWLNDRRDQFPAMHVYHYNHTERSSLERLATEHGAGESTLAAMISAGLFVDLYDVLHRRVQIGAESYGLKVTETLAGYQRSEEIGDGAGAVVHYERWIHDQDPSHLSEIAAYNEDDVRATLAVRDWLINEVLCGEPWREQPELDDSEAEENDLVTTIAELMATGVPEHRLLGHLLGYWWREGRADHTQRLAIFDSRPDELLDHREAIAGLQFCEYAPPTKGKKLQGAVFTFPPQEFDLKEDKPLPDLMFRLADGRPGYSKIRSLDLDEGTLTVTWKDAYIETGQFPGAVILDSPYRPKTQQMELLAFARRLLDGEHHDADAARLALLRRELPRLIGDEIDTERTFTSEISELSSVVTALDAGCLAIQGPPGTGKTYTGAHLISALVAAGQRVGVTAVSHAAIDNLLLEVAEVDPSVKVLRRGEPTTSIPNLTLKGEPALWLKGEHDVYAGTTWAFANEKMTAEPTVDVLIIDEAGQMSLADALAAMGSARKVILLGDPLQLPQVSKAVHPEGSGASVLDFVMGEEYTIEANRGVFLETTRRMHPDVCSFISRQMYEGRLSAHESCSLQSVDGETGLRWIRAEHQGRDTSSPEEAEIVASLVRSLIGREFIDHHGMTRTMTAADVMVVAPYNAQVDLITATLAADPDTADARVGTVDKFQGQEAPVVIFSMATSSQIEISRSVDFLFSRERLNVAISRARAMAYLVCTEELLNARAKTVEQMRLIGMLCAFVDDANVVDSASL